MLTTEQNGLEEHKHTCATYKGLTCNCGVFPMSSSTSLLSSLSALIEAWRTERDFLATGTGSDRTAACIYDECATQAMELVKANKRNLSLSGILPR
jgi:hypothetical protein